MAGLKLRKLPERAPVKLTITVSPELNRSLGEYAALYNQAYGENESLVDLLPYMLQAFLDSDRDFCRARRIR